MKRKVKGFTLVECIVAMALIAVASLFMAQIYASLSEIERGNKMLSTSLEEQMKKVEREQTEPGDNLTASIISGYSGGALGTYSADAKMTFVKNSEHSESYHYNDFSLERSDSNPVRNIDVVVYKSKNRTKEEGGRSYKMDESIRYKFVVAKKS